MRNYNFTMVNPQQIVSKGLKGCSSTRTVVSFAQKYGVPCVWWAPTRNQKVLLVDWPQFKTSWNQYWSGKTMTNPTWKSTGGNWTTGTTRTTGMRATKPTTARTTTRNYTGKTFKTTAKSTGTKATSGTKTYATYAKRTRRAA